MIFTLSAVVLFFVVHNGTLACVNNRRVPASQYSPPPPPPPSTSSCGQSIYYNTGQQFSSGIVGGLDAKRNEFPWMVRLRIISGSNSYVCGGSLISAQWVVTAAHCANAAVGTGAIVAVAGDHNRATDGEPGEVSVGVSRIVIHPNYNPRTTSTSPNDFDIALLQLSLNVSYTGAVQPICLPTNCTSSACQGGSTAWITGWGTQDDGSSSGTSILQRAWVPIVSTDKCQNAYSKVFTQITNQMLCAGFDEGGVDTCRGDSGGPLICNSRGFFELGGVTSFGQGCATPGFFGVYTRVCTVIDWIRSTTNIR